MTALGDLAPRWTEISALLDEALALPAAQRAAWLEHWAAKRSVEDELRSLLATHAGVETGDFLGHVAAARIALRCAQPRPSNRGGSTSAHTA